LNSTSIGFIGAGNMAGSLIRGMIARGTPATTISIADLDSTKIDQLVAELNVVGSTNDAIAATADVIVLAVKPQVMADVCKALALNGRDALVISVAAGITLSHLQSWLGEDTAIVRCMPNTPALVGRGATGLIANGNTSAGQKKIAEDMLNAVGISAWVNCEADIDAVTALSGSGPAYYFLFMEAMQEAALELGLDEQLVREFAIQTALGAAVLASESEDDIAELRRKVTSPGGTTERALQNFESGGLRDLVRQSLKAARDRSQELAAEFGAK
jgi:pyrroline-5-carboxylate reductase